MLVGRNVQELHKSPHQEQQAGTYDTRGCHVKFTRSGSFHASADATRCRKALNQDLELSRTDGS